MLSYDDIINVTNKWLEYHQSSYIVTTSEGNTFVAGSCLTDLRAFLKSVEHMDYWTALEQAKFKRFTL